MHTKNCNYGYECSNGVCLLINGEECNTNSDCASSFCNGSTGSTGKCDKKPGGEPCAENDECLSRMCSTKYNQCDGVTFVLIYFFPVQAPSVQSYFHEVAGGDINESKKIKLSSALLSIVEPQLEAPYPSRKLLSDSSASRFLATMSSNSPTIATSPLDPANGVPQINVTSEFVIDPQNEDSDTVKSRIILALDANLGYLYSLLVDNDDGNSDGNGDGDVEGGGDADSDADGDSTGNGDDDGDGNGNGNGDGDGDGGGGGNDTVVDNENENDGDGDGDGGKTSKTKTTVVIVGSIMAAALVGLIALWALFLVRKRSRRHKETKNYRREVLALLKRVAPEQVCHIDEIMLQFQGKEPELIEQLRGMKSSGYNLEVLSPIKEEEEDVEGWKMEDGKWTSIIAASKIPSPESEPGTIWTGSKSVIELVQMRMLEEGVTAEEGEDCPNYGSNTEDTDCSDDSTRFVEKDYAVPRSHIVSSKEVDVSKSSNSSGYDSSGYSSPAFKSDMSMIDDEDSSPSSTRSGSSMLSRSDFKDVSQFDISFYSVCSSDKDHSDYIPLMKNNGDDESNDIVDTSGELDETEAEAEAHFARTRRTPQKSFEVARMGTDDDKNGKKFLKMIEEKDEVIARKNAALKELAALIANLEKRPTDKFK